MINPIKPRRSKRKIAANGHECYELTDAAPSFVPKAFDVLQKDWGFTVVSGPTFGGDEIVAEVQRGNVRLFISWDIWTGFDILSQSSMGDEVVRELACYFDARKDANCFDNDFEQVKATH